MKLDPGSSRRDGAGRAQPAPAAAISSTDRWGPFAADLDEPERRARLRSMRAIVHLTTGSRGDSLARWLRLAEQDPDSLPVALDALNRLAALDRRRILASYAAINRTA